MPIKLLFIALFMNSSIIFSDELSISSTAEKIVGEMTGKFSHKQNRSAKKPLLPSQELQLAKPPEWITIEPRSIAECKQQSNGVLNLIFVRCRQGRQELVQFDSKGNKHVISERAMPN